MIEHGIQRDFCNSLHNELRPQILKCFLLETTSKGYVWQLLLKQLSTFLLPKRQQNMFGRHFLSMLLLLPLLTKSYFQRTKKSCYQVLSMLFENTMLPMLFSQPHLSSSTFNLYSKFVEAEKRLVRMTLKIHISVIWCQVNAS